MRCRKVGKMASPPGKMTLLLGKTTFLLEVPHPPPELDYLYAPSVDPPSAASPHSDIGQYRRPSTLHTLSVPQPPPVTLPIPSVPPRIVTQRERVDPSSYWLVQRGPHYRRRGRCASQIVILIVGLVRCRAWPVH